jgi:glutathione S-transferase
MLGAVANRLKLYVVPASHPCAAVERALALKGLAYDRVDLLPALHILHQRVVFGQRTVPALKLADGEKVTGSRAILRVLDGLEPEPPLLPGDPVLRSRVEAAEIWADDVLQSVARRITWQALRRHPAAVRSYAEGSRLPIPDALIGPSSGLVARVEGLVNRASAQAARADLAALPGHLDRVDELIGAGVLGGDQVNVADLQVGSTLRLLTTLGDVRPLVEDRPGGRLALRLFPRYPGSVPAGVLPAEWRPVA